MGGNLSAEFNKPCLKKGKLHFTKLIKHLWNLEIFNHIFDLAVYIK